MLKYRNKKTGNYDSRKEKRRAGELKLMQRSGIISSLQEQVKFELLPSQYEVINGKRKCIERGVSYIADFTYVDKDGNLVVEDAKSPVTRTKDYIIKRKMLLHFHGIKIKEV